ncbi:MAG: pyrroline-5-carboxylate reductase dimerization domain-containing protein [Pseudomonadota bacterium]
MTTVGLIGVGHLASYLVPGLLRGLQPEALLLSPRGRAQSAALAARHGLAVAESNQDLVERCDMVLLATRPGQAAEAVAALTWRQGQTLVSLCAGLPLAALEAGPATLARALPVSSALIGESPTCLTPDLHHVRALLAPLGPVIALPDEASFEVASVPSAYYGWIHALIAETSDWATRQGLPEATARALVAQTLRGAAGMILAEPERPVDDMIKTLATPGGITELGLRHLRETSAFGPWNEACDAVLARLKAPK